MSEIIFVPIDKEQSNMLIDSSLYGDSCSGPYSWVACKELGYKLIKEIKTVHEKGTPEKWIQNKEADYFVIGWECEVEKLEQAGSL